MDYSKYFKTRKRDEGEWFTELEDAPSQLVTFVKDVHRSTRFNECLDNNWIFQTISDAFEKIQNDNRDFDEIWDELEMDVHNEDVEALIFFLRNDFSSSFIEEAKDSFYSGEGDIWTQLSWGEFAAMELIYRMVEAFLVKSCGDELLKLQGKVK